MAGSATFLRAGAAVEECISCFGGSWPNCGWLCLDELSPSSGLDLKGRRKRGGSLCAMDELEHADSWIDALARQCVARPVGRTASGKSTARSFALVGDYLRGQS